MLTDLIKLFSFDKIDIICIIVFTLEILNVTIIFAMSPQKLLWVTVTLLCYIVSNAKLEIVTGHLSSSPQKIGMIVVGTADCNFCGMTFFGALSFKVTTKYIGID